MLEFPYLFSLAAAGSLLRLSTEMLLKRLDRRTQRDSVAAGPDRGTSDEAAARTDPVAIVGFTLTSYGAVALTLVSLQPGPLALARTALAFAILCVGGLISEISSTGSTARLPDLETHEELQPPRKPIPLRLSLALTLVLNLSFAVLGCGLSLIDIAAPRVRDADPTLHQVAGEPAPDRLRDR